VGSERGEEVVVVVVVVEEEEEEEEGLPAAQPLSRTSRTRSMSADVGVKSATETQRPEMKRHRR
jgi:hypothetical protein